MYFICCRLEDFDSHVDVLTQQYKQLPAVCQNAAILADFQRRWEVGRNNLELRLNRGRI